MNILVTGGAGFIGSNLTERLLEQGDTVRTLDNLSTGRLENMSGFLHHPRHTFLEHTVTDRDFLEPHIAWADHVYHLGAPVGVKYVMENPVRTILDNIRGIDAVLELVQKYGKRVLVASTSEVYGKSLDLLDPTHQQKLSEDDYRVEGSTQHHRWAYANTKAMDEFLALAYFKEFGTEAIVIRFFNTVGPRQLPNYGMVIPNLVARAVRNEELMIYGSGDQLRSFLHVNDAVRAITGLMGSGIGIGQVFNVGNPIEISINDLALRVLELSGSSSAIRHISYEEAYGSGFEDMNRRTADIGKLQDALGFRIEYDLDSILRDTIAYHRHQVAQQV